MKTREKAELIGANCEAEAFEERINAVLDEFLARGLLTGADYVGVFEFAKFRVCQLVSAQRACRHFNERGAA